MIVFVAEVCPEGQASFLPVVQLAVVLFAAASSFVAAVVAFAAAAVNISRLMFNCYLTLSSCKPPYSLSN